MLQIQILYIYCVLANLLEHPLPPLALKIAPETWHPSFTPQTGNE